MAGFFKPFEGPTQLGFVVQEEEGGFLKHNLIWFGHKSIKSTYVHPQYVLHYLTLIAQDWEVKPMWVYVVTGYTGSRDFHPDPIEFTFDYEELDKRIATVLGL
ncbi:MAG: hypothetical protein HQ539_01440 [Parcubacteria group bacterium]|nr:hypothetical protein [Parcubacteria group bacterium]